MLRQALADGFSADSPVFILGMVDEKDGAGFCAELATLAKRIVLSPVSSARSAKPDGFVVACQVANPAAAVEVAESLGQALEWCAAEPFVVVTGSFYLVGGAMERLARKSVVQGKSVDPVGRRSLKKKKQTPQVLVMQDLVSRTGTDL